MTDKNLVTPGIEHSVPWFWPLAAVMEMQKEGLKVFQDNLKYVAVSAKIVAPPQPDWATPNKVRIDLDTMRLRDFSGSQVAASVVPVLVDAPFAGHSSTIADYAQGQSLVETLLAAGLPRVLVTDWKSATKAMRDYDIDKYLADLDAAVDAAGGRVHLVGLCQGGWMSAMYACLHPDKVCSLVLAGSPIDTNAGNGPIRKIAHEMPLSFYQEMVDAGGGLMRGQFMLAGWKNMHPDQQYVGKFVDLYEHIEDSATSSAPNSLNVGMRTRSICLDATTCSVSSCCSKRTALRAASSLPMARRCRSRPLPVRSICSPGLATISPPRSRFLPPKR